MMGALREAGARQARAGPPSGPHVLPQVPLQRIFGQNPVDSETPLSTEKLLERCRRSDPGAWELLVRRYENLIYSVARRWYNLPQEEAEEVLQETFMALLRSLDRVRPDRLSSWLISTAVRWSKKRCVGVAVTPI